MLIKNINFKNIESSFLKILQDIGDEYLDANIDFNLGESNLEEFNNRIITPENINNIIHFCDYLLLEDIDNFIITNSVPTKIIYELDEYNIKYHNLPDFMNGNITCNEVIKYGLLNWLIYAYENKYPYDEHTIVIAAEYGKLDCLKYLHENGFELNEPDICKKAAQYGYLDCIKYLIENNCAIDKWTCTYAIYKDNIDCIKYLHENGCPWNEDTCALAASYGQLDILIYAHKNGCPWNEETPAEAILKDNYNCLKYAIDNGCQCDHYCFDFARKKNDYKYLNYLELRFNRLQLENEHIIQRIV